MRRLIKGIFTIILTVGFVIVTEYIMFNNIKACAQSKADLPVLKDIYVSQGEDINFSKDINSYIVDIPEDDEEIFVKAKPEDEDFIVRINGEVVVKDNKYKKSIKLNMGKNKIVIEVSSNKKFSNDKYYEDYCEGKEKDDTSDISRYLVYIFRGGQDTVFLKNISINESNMGFNQAIKYYNMEIDDDSEFAEFKFDKFDEEDTILVNNKILKNTDYLKIKFNGIGKYTVTVDVIDSETKRKGTYTFNIYYGIPVSPNISQSINNIIKPNQWIIINGRWQLNDSLGQAIKNRWFYDKRYNSYFYFNGRGNMKTGWINEGGNTYYLGNDGAMKTGWIDYEGKWYYLDMNGVMRTDWIKNNGQWYYLDRDGSMKTGWIVDKEKWYYLNNDGSMETGWVLDHKKWYYLSQNGAMKTGWAQYDDEWYYLNNDGSMKSGEWIQYKDKWYYVKYSGVMICGWMYKDDKYYYFNEDGSMRTEPIMLDGYVYKFNEDGSVNFDD